ncbi:hypothetical protein N7493_002487 [Penicillium malachiteum]|uniref:Uncharacterized protein n=1 Tax=Penicillium malachiteum TaxID=1324776 RepID=A0AAD6HSH1_9EURO|nr:hypothetical protein N7493_002487 [Penicillium malachiteum]
MNWTGGQLHRHSRPGGLSKNQKQKFAKSRLTRNKTPGETFEFDGFPNLPFSQRDKRDTAEADQTGNSSASQAAKVFSSSTAEPGSLKRSLLQQSDWAAVSVTRPLNINFTSATESARFGKRRRLTEIDRERLSIRNGDHSLLQGHRFRKNAAGTVERESDLGHIQVRIDGHLAGSNFGEPQTPTTHPSSNSMLLDNENENENAISSFSSSLPAHRGTSQRLTSRRLSLAPSHNRTPLRLQEPMNTAGTSVVEYSDDCLSQIADSGVSSTNHYPSFTQLEPDHASLASIHHVSTGSPLARPRRFTIDDQFFAEQLQLNRKSEYSSQEQYESSYSPKERSTSPPLIPTDSLFEKTSSWLAHQKQIPGSRNIRSSRSGNYQSSAIQADPRTLPSSPSLVADENGYVSGASEDFWADP